jgi:hypothetical protein
VLDAWAKRAPTSEIVETFVTLCERWHVTIAGIEDLGQQYLLVEPILALAQVKNYEIPLATVKPSFRVDKNFRIRTVLDPLVREGRLIIGDNHDDLWSELTTFPMNSTKDLVDSLTSCVALMPPKQQKRHHDSEVEGVAAYLRDSGVAPSVIERKIQQLRFERGEQEFEEPTNPWQKLFEIRKVVQNG